MRYKPKSIAALHIALGGLPVKMRVEVDLDIGVSAKSPIGSNTLVPVEEPSTASGTDLCAAQTASQFDHLVSSLRRFSRTTSI